MIYLENMHKSIIFKSNTGTVGEMYVLSLKMTLISLLMSF